MNINIEKLVLIFDRLGRQTVVGGFAAIGFMVLLAWAAKFGNWSWDRLIQPKLDCWVEVRWQDDSTKGSFSERWDALQQSEPANRHLCVNSTDNRNRRNRN
jgi:hypothetical protein